MGSIKKFISLKSFAAKVFKRLKFQLKKNNYKNIWQYEKKIFIFAQQKNN